MRLASLRSKIFLLVGFTLLLGALAVMVVTERDVTRTVIAGQELAVRNVLHLLVHDSEARWGGLLNDKITTVRNERTQLVQQGRTVRSVFDMLVRQVEQGELTTSQAQALARQWVDQLVIDQDRYSFVFDRALITIASGREAWRGLDLSGLKDLKGRELAASAYREARTTGQSFAIFRGPPSPASGDTELRFAYFAYFEPWDWVFSITGDAREVSMQFERRRERMERSLGESLRALRLAHSGFAFITSRNEGMVAAPPASSPALMAVRDAGSGLTLQQLLSRVPDNGEVETFLFDPVADEGDWQISAAHFKPLGWTIVAAVPTADLTRAAVQLRNRLAGLFLAVLGAALLVAWGLSIRITRPLEQLSEFARALPEQDLSAAGPIPEHIARLPKKQPDEVGRLAATFMFMDKELREKVGKLLQETSSRERIESELNIAQSIQMGLLPIPLASAILEQVDLTATMIPAKEVGGDLYDYFLLPDGRLCLAIGDVSGKGVPAALFMAVTRTLIRASAEDEHDPALLMERVNNRLSENNPNLMFVTLILAVLDLATGELTWANAGHPAPCVIQQDRQLRWLEGRSGPACGVQEGLPYRSFKTELCRGEALVGYTDGVTEALAPDGALYGEPRLFALLADLPSSGAQGIAESLLRDVRHFADGTEQSDDITLIIAKRPNP